MRGEKFAAMPKQSRAYSEFNKVDIDKLGKDFINLSRSRYGILNACLNTCHKVGNYY